MYRTDIYIYIYIYIIYINIYIYTYILYIFICIYMYDYLKINGYLGTWSLLFVYPFQIEKRMVFWVKALLLYLSAVFICHNQEKYQGIMRNNWYKLTIVFDNYKLILFVHKTAWSLGKHVFFWNFQLIVYFSVPKNSYS